MHNGIIAKHNTDKILDTSSELLELNAPLSSSKEIIVLPVKAKKLLLVSQLK